MKPDHILVRFGELTTKGKNRKQFIRKLLKNTKEILHDYSALEYELTYDRLYIYLNEENAEEVTDKLKTIFGIHNFSLCYKVEHDLEKAKEVVTYIIDHDEGHTFKIDTKRHDKSYPKTSIEMNKEIAGYVFHHTTKELSVDVHNPDILVRVEYRKDAIYIMDNMIPGAGGYPVGIGGKALLMLSGGIDSPVAGYLALKRGVDIECLYFESPPHTSIEAKNKVFKLASILNEYSGNVKVHVVPFTKIQEEIYKNVKDSYIITIMRRMMYRIASEYCKRKNFKIIVNGESIGQVASQTLDSMIVINNVTNLPVIRPVACLDKLEIIEIAKKINTYETSILPYEDCCTIFLPKHPVINPSLEKCLIYENNFNYEELIEDAINNIEVVTKFIDDYSELL